MTAFDETLPIIAEILKRHKADLSDMDWLLVNRDLKGKIRLIAPVEVSESKLAPTLEEIAKELESRLGDRAYPAEYAILYDENREDACKGASLFPLEGFDNIEVADRLPVSERLSIALRIRSPPCRFLSVKRRWSFPSDAASALSWRKAKSPCTRMDLASPGLTPPCPGIVARIRMWTGL